MKNHEARPARRTRGRYFADPAQAAVWDAVLDMVKWAANNQRAGEWITYLIRDPRYPDNKGKSGRPIYVGQTNNFPKRVLTRFKTCEKEAIRLGKDCVEKRVADLLHRGIVPAYEVLSYEPTHLASLVAETNMAREAWNRGYNLANNGELQNGPGDRITRHQIPSKWIWDRFSVDEAVQDELEIDLRCSSCRIQLRIEVGHFKRIAHPPKTLKQIKVNPVWSSEPCTYCGAVGSRSLGIVVP